LHLIYGGDKKNDALDARHLAELGRIDRDLLHPVKPMDKERQQDLVVVKARELLVRNRTSIINTIRGQLRSLGYSDKGFTVENMNKKADSLPEELKPLLTPLFQQLTYLSLGLKEYDRQIRELCKKYPDTKILRQIAGIGEITALAFVLRVGDATRFPTGERLSSFFGLVPKQDQSGEMDKQGKITKDGNNSMRRLLVQAANYIMGPFGPPCDLRDLGERIASKGGKIGKRKAKVAVARKLVTVLYAIWRNSEVPYDPHFKATRKKQKGIA
jgi:transposase